MEHIRVYITVFDFPMMLHCVMMEHLLSCRTVSYMAVCAMING